MALSARSNLSVQLISIMKDVTAALDYDSKDRNEDAYRKYMECVLKVTTSLLKTLHADEGHLKVNQDVQKMIRLGQQCMDRAANIIGAKMDKTPTKGMNLPLSTYPVSTPSGTVTPATPGQRGITTSRGTTPTAQVTSPAQSFGSEHLARLGKDKSDGSVSLRISYGGSRKLSPMEIASLQNQQLLAAFRRRQTQTTTKSASATLSLTIQRKMAENLAIGRAQEVALAKKMAERQARLEEQATRRFHAPMGLSKEEQHQRQVYKKVLEFEQDQTWFVGLRMELDESPTDITVISRLVAAVIGCASHPVTEELSKYQNKILDKLTAIVEGKSSQVKEISVPLPKKLYATIRTFKLDIERSKQSKKLDIEELNETKMESEIDSQEESDGETAIVDDMLKDLNLSENDIDKQHLNTGIDSVTEIIKGDIDKALEKGKDVERKLEKQNKFAKSLTIQSAEEYEKYNQENMDDLFDSDNDMDDSEAEQEMNKLDQDKEKGNNVEIEVKDKLESSIGLSSTNDNNDKEEEEKEANDFVEKKNRTDQSNDKNNKSKPKLRKNSSAYDLEQMISSLKDEALTRHLDGITEEIISSLERIQVLFMIVYEGLNSGEGRDQCNAHIEDAFFPQIWPHLFLLFRLANKHKEVCLASVMTENMSSSPRDFDIRTELCLVAMETESDDVTIEIKHREETLATGDLSGTTTTEKEVKGLAVMELDKKEEIPYQSAVKELASISNLSTMMAKLEVLVRTSKEIVNCVEEYHTKLGNSVPGIGADDLLPILCYVVTRSQQPQLLSECIAVERFIHEGYMFGEEGYCLTSFQTAINYLVARGLHRSNQS
ncbi:VPS9 domain-containing protein 1-like [Mya arenaria]|uniref:VPS9 domain-containing protein 1-like n=1 Tax=Mya arenaria TaxID=6604 RepID=UPI0022DFE4C7|nr:VPS9 domain-containing protein 1-like [Mya arenaria]